LCARELPVPTGHPAREIQDRHIHLKRQGVDDMQTVEADSKRAGRVPSALAGLAVVSISNGTEVDVEDFLYLIPNASFFRQRVTVVESGRDGIRMVW